MTKPGPGAVDYRLPEVGDRLVRVAQPPPGPVHRDEGVLYDVLGRRRVAQQQRGQPHQRPVVRGVERHERLVGVASGGVHEPPPSLRRYDIHHDRTTPTPRRGFTVAACPTACSVASCPATSRPRSWPTTPPRWPSATSTRPHRPTSWSFRATISPTWRQSPRPSRTPSSPC